MKKLLFFFLLLCAAPALPSGAANRSSCCASGRSSCILDRAVYVDKATFRKQYKLGRKQWDAAFKYISNPCIDTLPPGVWSNLEGGARARLNTIRTKHSGSYELHRKYIDLFYAVDGPVRIGVARPEDLQEPKREYTEKNDCALWKKSAHTDYYIINKGQMIILFPTDGHSSNLSVGEPCETKMVIVKIPYVSK